MSPREEAMQRVRKIMGMGNLLAYGDDVRHLLAAYDDAVAALAKVTAQRDELRQWIEAYRGKLGSYPETAHGQRVACDDILERMDQPPAEKAEGGA